MYVPLKKKVGRVWVRVSRELHGGDTTAERLTYPVVLLRLP